MDLPNIKQILYIFRKPILLKIFLRICWPLRGAAKWPPSIDHDTRVALPPYSNTSKYCARTEATWSLWTIIFWRTMRKSTDISARHSPCWDTKIKFGFQLLLSHKKTLFSSDWHCEPHANNNCSRYFYFVEACCWCVQIFNGTPHTYSDLCRHFVCW